LGSLKGVYVFRITLYQICAILGQNRENCKVHYIYSPYQTLTFLNLQIGILLVKISEQILRQ